MEGMREAAPVPSSVTPKKLVQQIERRHPEDAGLPDPEDLLAMCAYVARVCTGLAGKPSLSPGQREQVQADVHDALLLTRLARQQLDRHELALLRAGRAADMTARQLGAPLGLTSRAAAGDRIESLQRRTEAARHHTSRAALRDIESLSADTGTDPLAAATVLLEHYAHLSTNRETDDWAEGIELVLRRPSTARSASSVRAQLRVLLEEVDRAAVQQGRAPAATSEAEAALRAARRVCATTTP